MNLSNRWTVLLSILGVYASSVCAMEPLADEALANTDGQAGVYLDWDLQLNQTTPGFLDPTLCQSNELQYCRLAISPANRGTGENQKWLVMKGMQGSIRLQNVSLTGTDIVFNSGASVKAAITLGFNAEKPTLIRNYGFDAISIETGVAANSYFNTSKYDTATHGAFDGTHPVISGSGREVGFTGMMMHGNLAIGGNLKVFSK